MTPEEKKRRYPNVWRVTQELNHCKYPKKVLNAFMVRIAALLHLSSFPATEPVSPETMAGATSIAEFLGAHAMAAYQMMGADEAQEDAKYILKRVVSEGKKKLTRSELTRLCRGKFQKAADMDPAINELSDRGYIRCLENDVGYNNRKQISYEVNPSILGK